MLNYQKNIDVCRETILQIKSIIFCYKKGFFRQITSPNIIASQVKLTELFEILLKVGNECFFSFF